MDSIIVAYRRGYVEITDAIKDYERLHFFFMCEHKQQYFPLYVLFHRGHFSLLGDRTTISDGINFVSVRFGCVCIRHSVQLDGTLMRWPPFFST